MTVTPESLDFLVKRDDWAQCRFASSPAPGDLAPGQVLWRIDRFAFTANNISYAMAGDLLKYWNFFPAEEGWGRLPTMGFADVVASRCDGVDEGLRAFGFYPMSRYLVIEPKHASPTGIIDGVPHREPLAPAYNTYSPVASDPSHAPEHEDAYMLMRGLFMTSYLADDFLAEQDHYGADQVIIASASSKTAIAMAYLVAKSGKARAIGLTSPRNAEFVRGLGYYDDVVLYDELESISAEGRSVFVDMSGDGPVVNRLHRHLGNHLKYSCMIGGTHWAAGQRDSDLPGATPEFFFAPGQIQKRAQEWGPEELQRRIGEAWNGFREASEGWLKVVRGSGRKAVEDVYRATLEGCTQPEAGHVLSMWDTE